MTSLEKRLKDQLGELLFGHATMAQRVEELTQESAKLAHRVEELTQENAKLQAQRKEKPPAK